MANVSLTYLIQKIRKLTARPSSNQISDASIVDYINLFYQYDFPQALKIFDFHTTYTFYTQPNQDTYVLSQNDRNLYKSFEPPVFCSGYYINYYQNREQFYRFWPALFTSTNLATATGIAGPYTGTISGTPILSKSVLISAVDAAGVTQILQDFGDGTDSSVNNLEDINFPGVSVGTVEYLTGLCTFTFGAVIPAGNIITVKYTPYTASRPLGLLFYNNTFTLRPIPDQAYKIDLQTYIQPFAVAPVTDVPEEYAVASPNALPLLADYFQLLAYGAACKIFVDSLEMDNYRMILPLLQEQMSFAERKTMMQIKTQRTQTIYSENLYWNSNRLPTV
jgi:hypothetical protein